jgi:hypothetical protein
MHVADDLARLREHAVVDGHRAGERDRQPRVDAGDAREAAWPEHAGIGEDEIGRHNADDLERHVIEGERLADNRGVGAEAAAPVAVAQHDDAVFFAHRENPAERRRAPEHVEHVRRDEHAVRHLDASVGLHRRRRDE